MHRSKQHRCSITSSARVSSIGGTMMPSAFAVFKLITNSNLVGCLSGRSSGRPPSAARYLRALAIKDSL
jgi:hypothetical protein